MKMSVRRIIIVSLLTQVILVAGIWPRHASAGEGRPAYGGTLRLSDQTDGVSIGYPPKLVRIYGNKQVAPAVETLLRTDTTGKPIPWLASGVKEKAADRTITLNLRKGVKFHDGTDLNAEAVKWNLDQCIAARASGTEKFRSVDAIDTHTVRINLSSWDSTVTSNLALTTGMIVSPTAFRKNGEQWAASHPVGTGPFEFVSWEKDVRTIYRKFPGYWQKGKPYLDRVEWIPMPDPLTRQMSLRKGELDLALTIGPKDVAGLVKEGFVVVRGKTGSGAATLVPDSANPASPWANLKVRQAAQHAVDTAAIVQAVFYGEAEPANQWIYRGHWGYNPSVAGYPYNPAKAKQLLTEAGYPNGFKTKLIYRTTPQEDQFFTAVQGYLRAVGIDAELEPVQNARWNQLAWTIQIYQTIGW